MDEIERLKEDVRQGRVDSNRLVDVIVKLQRSLQEARRRIDELERKPGGSGTVKIEQSFSLRAEEKRQESRGKKARKRKRPLRRGRITTADKLLRAERTEKVFPSGVAPSACRLSHVRVMWRLEQGRAVLVAYEVYRGPKNRYGQILGALGRCEFGLEIIVAIAYQVYIVGLSFDKACLLLNFFQNLRLRKSQVDALLHRLSRHWESEFEFLCGLLANSAVVHADETSWRLNSVWAFLSERVRLLFFGVHKDAATLERILDPRTFAGIVVSDDAAVYANFTRSQKCWAHLLRKAIKLTLQAPADPEFRDFTDCLLEIYRAACRVQRDRRLSDAGRKQRVDELDDRIVDLCAPGWAQELPKLHGPDDDYRLLINELMRLMLDRQLFTFVTAPPVVTPLGESMPIAGTNNEAERTLRSAAEARKTGRTSKTSRGARRRTILVSVLESLRPHLPTFTLSTVIQEILHWSRIGCSRFRQLSQRLAPQPASSSVLNALLPVPSG